MPKRPHPFLAAMLFGISLALSACAPMSQETPLDHYPAFAVPLAEDSPVADRLDAEEGPDDGKAKDGNVDFKVFNSQKPGRVVVRVKVDENASFVGFSVNAFDQRGILLATASKTDNGSYVMEFDVDAADYYIAIETKKGNGAYTIGADRK